LIAFSSLPRPHFCRFLLLDWWLLRVHRICFIATEYTHCAFTNGAATPGISCAVLDASRRSGVVVIMESCNFILGEVFRLNYVCHIRQILVWYLYLSMKWE
jgi:hypothetical protein